MENAWVQPEWFGDLCDLCKRRARLERCRRYQIFSRLRPGRCPQRESGAGGSRVEDDPDLLPVEPRVADQQRLAVRSLPERHIRDSLIAGRPVDRDGALAVLGQENADEAVGEVELGVSPDEVLTDDAVDVGIEPGLPLSRGWESGLGGEGLIPDGAYFVNLAPISEPSLVITTIAQTLGLREGGWVRVEGTTAHLGGLRGARIFRRGREPEERPVGADLSDLL